MKSPISQQGDDVRIEMSGFAEHKFVANITVGDFISSLPEAVVREFRKISESDSGLHVRLSAISSISKQDYIADDTNKADAVRQTSSYHLRH